jgi:hypothetical protein
MGPTPTDAEGTTMTKELLFQGPGLFLLAALIISCACHLMVIVVMSNQGENGLAAVSVMTTFMFGLGFLVTFLTGWANAERWRIGGLMYIWTAVLMMIVSFGVAMNVMRRGAAPAGKVDAGPVWVTRVG